MKTYLRAVLFAAILPCAAEFCVSCGGGDTVDGVTTEQIELYSGAETTGDPHVPDANEQALYERVKTYFDSYYDIYCGGAEHTTSFDPAERGDYGGDECYIFHSSMADGEDGFLIAASTDGQSVYGYEPSTGQTGLIWCEGWTAPDFSYFGDIDISGL